MLLVFFVNVAYRNAPSMVIISFPHQTDVHIETNV